MCKWKLLGEYKKLVVASMKGGDKMTELKSLMIEGIKDIRQGTLPLETAKQMHLMGHRAYMAEQTRIKASDRIVDQVMIESLKKANELAKSVSDRVVQ